MSSALKHDNFFVICCFVAYAGQNKYNDITIDNRDKMMEKIQKTYLRCLSRVQGVKLCISTNNCARAIMSGHNVFDFVICFCHMHHNPEKC